jgi:hypothetical protein
MLNRYDRSAKERARKRRNTADCRSRRRRGRYSYSPDLSERLVEEMIPTLLAERVNDKPLLLSTEVDDRRKVAKALGHFVEKWMRRYLADGETFQIARPFGRRK